MKQVIRYQCEFCKKEFKTPDRHYCKKNPKLKNCFTCKHLKGWLELMDMLESENEGGKMINCQYYVPAWAGNKTTSSQPDWCLKHGVILNGKCLKNCNEKKDVRNSELQGEVHA